MQSTNQNNNNTTQKEPSFDKTNDALRLLKKMKDAQKKCRLVLHFDGTYVKVVEVSYVL